MAFDLSKLTDLLTTESPVARVVVARVQGSAPREVGADMWVWDGGQSGTIGGGALEYEAAARALAHPGVFTHALGPDLGQCCGGSVTLLTEVFTRSPGKDCYRLVQFGTAPKPLRIQRTEAAARKGDAICLTYDNGWLIEPMHRPKAPVWIWGAGHVGRALVDVLAPLPGVELTWIDTHQDRFPPRIAPGVTTLPTADPALLMPHAPKDAQHVILTYSHALDLALCHAALTRGFAFAGLIGSKTKWARFRSRLDRLGHGAAQISRITCPIGDPALGKHPQAIAVGVAASLLSTRHNVSTRHNDAALPATTGQIPA